MLTASVVTYHTSLPEISAVLDCALQSPIDKLYIIDNSRNDALRILERRSPKIRYIHNANIGYGGAHNLAIREAMELGAKYHIRTSGFRREQSNYLCLIWKPMRM